MKYVLYCVLVLAICIGAAVLRVHSINKRKHWNKPASAAVVLLLSVIYMAAAGVIYMQFYYHADDTAKACLEGGGQVTVSTTENGYLFDGPGTDSAVIFYPGAKVEAEAYAPLMLELAEKGEDAFLVKMPFRFAFFGIDSAEALIDSYDYDSWYMMGHSMGGLAACSFVSEHSDDADGLIYLASYPSGGPFEGVKMLSIYGSEDGCLNMEEYEKSRPLWPDSAAEVVIEGGNHAQFGSYGAQKGDGEAKISAEEQRRITAEAIKKWLSE